MDRLSSSTVRTAPPEELLEEELLLEEVELEELELDELLLEDVVLLELLEELLLEELDAALLDEDEPLEPVPPSPTQAGAMKLPSWLPWKPKALLAVWPGPGTCQPQQLVNWKLVPGVLPAGMRVTFQEPPGVICSGKFSVTVQPLKGVVPVLVTLTSTWKKLPPVLDGVAVQLYAAKA